MYRISFQIGNVSFEIESSDQKWVEAKEKQYLKEYVHRTKPLPQNDIVTSARGEPRIEARPVTLSPHMSINEFYKKYVKDITSRPDIAVFMVYYLQKVLKKDDITTADVTRCFANVSYPQYNRINMTDVLSRAKKKAFLNYINNFWKLTLTGEDFVLNAISGGK